MLRSPSETRRYASSPLSRLHDALQFRFEGARRYLLVAQPFQIVIHGVSLAKAVVIKFRLKEVDIRADRPCQNVVMEFVIFPVLSPF